MTREGEGLVFVATLLSSVGILCWLCYMMAEGCGWNRLAERFPGGPAFDGRLFPWQSARFHAVRYSASLSVGLSREGLYVVPMWPFRLFHRPLLIPWQVLRSELCPRWLFAGYRISVQGFSGVTFLIGGRAAKALRERLAEKA